MSVNVNELFNKLNNIVNDSSVPQWAITLTECCKGFMVIINENHQLNQEIVSLREDVKKLKEVNDDYEQRNRNDCLVLHGLPESNAENTDEIVVEQIKEKMGIDISIDDIKRSHRLGTRRSTNVRSTRAVKPPPPRPIIFRLMNFRKRSEIYFSKKKLKGTGVTVTENLTRTRYDLYKQALEKFGKTNVWTIEGRIVIKVDNTKHYVTTHDEFSSVISTD